MLRELFIQNIILIESAKLEFEFGFYVFSGETGAGKTAVLEALSLALGKKADPKIVRAGKDKGFVEALFELKKGSPLFSILKEAGIEVEDEELLVKREVSSLGKSKVYLNNQMAQLALLKQIAPFLMEIVSQHATQTLFDIEFHRDLLDRFGAYQSLTKEVKDTHFQLQSMKRDLASLIEKETNENRLKSEWSEALEEIESAQVQAIDEDEKLFQEYETLSMSEEIHSQLSKTYHVLLEDEHSILGALKAESSALYKLQLSTPEFKSLQEDFRSLVESLSDLAYSLLKYRDSIEENPQRLFELDERLKLLRSLCKSYGPTLQDVLNNKEQLQLSLSQFHEISESKQELIKAIEEKEKQLQNLCQELSNKRAKAKEKLIEKIESLFTELNLTNAKFSIDLSPIVISDKGAEQVEFFLQANKGEKRTSLREKVSGGELSRVLLALKVILSELEEVPTLIFDEIDANVGGETAPKIAKLFKKMSQNKQVIIITHLPQVAAFADHHYQIRKQEEHQRTYSIVEQLDEKQKLKEIERMLGGKNLSGKASDLAKDLLYSSKS